MKIRIVERNAFGNLERKNIEENKRIETALNLPDQLGEDYGVDDLPDELDF